ncbi:hypothetical protein Syn7502_01617 [Synechococcus sp. PCC 7502]|uniref:hypothetical protein n=1 Tax=Synechococcus sp. PCC 7502 TaxID=1173263 RepID=UPI00029FA223|nr:hypothetical protein [Synechococcus sp. PCC 7502]AFY73673.1 hypothetical protein Syn7502_01617 [Synechococcus sp. PCC 7502]
MGETAVNLLAIAIFTITMTALTSPLTGISPFIPTGITVFCLAIYALDNAYQEGKGGAAIISWIESKFPNHKEKQARILYHEAGHFLVAHLLGIKVVGYKLKPQAGVEVDNSTVGLNTLERYCTIWMAGIAAEEYLYQNANGGDDDLLKLRAAIAHTPNPGLEERWAKVRARNLIRANKEAFAALVGKMQEEAPVEACYQVIDALAIREL